MSIRAVGSTKITAIFGENVFTLKTARDFLSDEAYKSLVASIKGGKKIDRAMANQIACRSPPMGRNQRSYSFYALVSAINRYHCRKT